MDHLPTLRGSSAAHHSVPYLGTASHGDAPFEEFPGRQGWDKAMLEEGDFTQGHDKRTAAAFLQTWLYFGILFELSIAGRCEPPKTEEFVRSGGSRLITTQKLDDFIRKRVSKLANTSQQKRFEALDRLNKALGDARLVTEKLWMKQKQESERCPLPFEVIVSIMVLGCTIDSALLESQLTIPRRQWRLSDVAILTMEQNSWCRRDITLAATHLTEMSMYYVMGLRRNEGDHSRCSEYACEVNQIDESTYQTKHRTTNCNCQFWYADEERLQEMIRQDEIPYIQLKRNTKTKEGNVVPIDAQLKSFRNSKVEGPHNRMVIFSHVWSDGLGNLHHNALPMCQLSLFYDMLCDSPWQDIVAHQFEDPGRKKALVETDGAFPTKSMRKWNRKQFNTSIPIWVDTLCVPLEKTTKKKAISMLGRYYSFAGMTAVLDRELLVLSYKQFSQSELLLRIGLSGWMRRCWTMQEAIIAGGSLCVRFSDGWLNVPDVVASVRKKNDIGVSLMNEEQQQSITKSRKRLKACCIPCAACIFILTLPVTIPQYIMNALCKRGPKKAWKTVKPERAPPSSTVADRLLVDSKAFFSIITSLCGKAAAPKDRDYMENRVQRIILAWQGLRFRNTSHEEDRFINFAFACAKRQEDFKFMKGVLDQDTGDRLRCWLLGQSAVPSGLLFMKGPKMPFKGYRWAPSDIHPSAIEDSSIAKLLPANNAIGAPEGSLQLQQPGFAFQGGVPRNTKSLEIVDYNSNSLFVLELDWDSCNAEEPGSGKKALIVCGNSLAEASMTGAVLNNLVSKGGTYMGEFYCRAQVTRPSGVNSVSQEIVYSVEQQLGKDQTWVVY